MKTCTVIHGPRNNPQVEMVQILGILANARLDAKMARQFARTSPGHLNGVSVIDKQAGHGYRFYSGKNQSHRRFRVLLDECDRLDDERGNGDEED